MPATKHIIRNILVLNELHIASLHYANILIWDEWHLCHFGNSNRGKMNVHFHYP